MIFRVAVTPTAERQFDRVESWWRKHRDKNPEVFVDEFARAAEFLRADPDGGFLIKSRVGEHFRRVILARCGYHVYYWHEPGTPTLWVTTFWGARKKRGPSLSLREVRR